MIGTQPPHDATSSPPHLDLAEAASRIMWTMALATTRAAVATTAHNLALWSLMLRVPPLQMPVDTPPIAPGATSEDTGAPAPASAPAETTAPDNSAPLAAPAEGSTFASYRSSGGHAAAQVTKPD